MSKKIKRENIELHLIEKQFNLIELTMLDAFFEHKWREKWTITKKQQEKFKQYAIPLIKKTLKCSKQKAQVALDKFIQQFGLRVEN